jgi:D-alanyl-D-alanine carboxypeptidase
MKKTITLTLFSVFVASLAFVVLNNIPAPNGMASAVESSVREAALPSKEFPEVQITASAAYVYDIKNDRVLYSKDSRSIYPLASLTKVMSVIVASDLTNREMEDEQINALMKKTLVASSNSDAHLLAATALGVSKDSSVQPFIEKMNLRANDMGLTHTFFFNETGLDIGSKNGGYSSAEEFTKIFLLAIEKYYSKLELTRDSKIVLDDGVIYNTNYYIPEIPNLIASKTGYTELAGGNLAIAFDVGIGHPVVAVVLHSTSVGRFEDMQKIVKATFLYYSSLDSQNN